MGDLKISKMFHPLQALFKGTENGP